MIGIYACAIFRSRYGSYDYSQYLFYMSNIDNSCQYIDITLCKNKVEKKAFLVGKPLVQIPHPVITPSSDYLARRMRLLDAVSDGNFS